MSAREDVYVMNSFNPIQIINQNMCEHAINYLDNIFHWQTQPSFS